MLSPRRLLLFLHRRAITVIPVTVTVIVDIDTGDKAKAMMQVM